MTSELPPAIFSDSSSEVFSPAPESVDPDPATGVWENNWIDLGGEG